VLAADSLAARFNIMLLELFPIRIVIDGGRERRLHADGATER
jgi:hypothetical protein